MRAIENGECQLQSVSDDRAFAHSEKILSETSDELLEPDDVCATSDMSKVKPMKEKLINYDFLPLL